MADAPNLPPPPRNRLILGGGIFVVGWCAPLLIPVVTATDWSTKWKTIVGGVLALGVPELFMVIAIAILGKSGFVYLKSRILRFFKRHAMPHVVGRTRYRIGLLLLFTPVLLGWAAPYVQAGGVEFDWFRLALVSDLVVLVSLVVLGGEFWDKIRALFVYRARAEFPPT